MTVRAEIGTQELADLIEQVRAGNEIVLTQDNKPVAKLVAAVEENAFSHEDTQIRSLTGHRVLTPVISQEELAEEMFGQP